MIYKTLRTSPLINPWQFSFSSHVVHMHLYPHNYKLINFSFSKAYMCIYLQELQGRQETRGTVPNAKVSLLQKTSSLHGWGQTSRGKETRLSFLGLLQEEEEKHGELTYTSKLILKSNQTKLHLKFLNTNDNFKMTGWDLRHSVMTGHHFSWKKKWG